MAENTFNSNSFYSDLGREIKQRDRQATAPSQPAIGKPDTAFKPENFYRDPGQETSKKYIGAAFPDKSRVKGWMAEVRRQQAQLPSTQPEAHLTVKPEVDPEITQLIDELEARETNRYQEALTKLKSGVTQIREALATLNENQQAKQDKVYAALSESRLPELKKEAFRRQVREAERLNRQAYDAAFEPPANFFSRLRDKHLKATNKAVDDVNRRSNQVFDEVQKLKQADLPPLIKQLNLFIQGTAWSVRGLAGVGQGAVRAGVHDMVAGTAATVNTGINAVDTVKRVGGWMAEDLNHKTDQPGTFTEPLPVHKRRAAEHRKSLFDRLRLPTSQLFNRDKVTQPSNRQLQGRAA